LELSDAEQHHEATKTSRCVLAAPSLYGLLTAES
jgi:hypothetical protein